jgi:hypothetical protein
VRTFVVAIGQCPQQWRAHGRGGAARAATSVFLRAASAKAPVGVPSRTMRVAVGTSCRRRSNRFAPSSAFKKLIPVRLPPGPGLWPLSRPRHWGCSFERAMTRDGTVGRSDATERSLPFHWDIDPARVMRPRFAEPPAPYPEDVCTCRSSLIPPSGKSPRRFGREQPARHLLSIRMLCDVWTCQLTTAII